MDKGTLYQRLTGDGFDRLPPVLQRFHAPAHGHSSRACGRVTVQGGTGYLRQGAVRILRLPRPRVDIPIQLQVIPQGQSERWIRHFGDQRIESLQWQENGFLVEKAGPLCFIFRVVASEVGLTFVCQQNRMQGLKLPSCLSLRVAATATANARDDHWSIDVGFQVPVLGTLTRYSGEIHPLP